MGGGCHALTAVKLALQLYSLFDQGLELLQLVCTSLSRTKKRSNGRALHPRLFRAWLHARPPPLPSPPLPCCSDKDAIFAFSSDCAAHIAESYVPIINKHKRDPYSPRQKEWQQLRRGRYVEVRRRRRRGLLGW